MWTVARSSGPYWSTGGGRCADNRLRGGARVRCAASDCGRTQGAAAGVVCARDAARTLRRSGRRSPHPTFRESLTPSRSGQTGLASPPCRTPPGQSTGTPLGRPLPIGSVSRAGLGVAETVSPKQLVLTHVPRRGTAGGGGCQCRPISNVNSWVPMRMWSPSARFALVRIR